MGLQSEEEGVWMLSAPVALGSPQTLRLGWCAEVGLAAAVVSVGPQ